MELSSWIRGKSHHTEGNSGKGPCLYFGLEHGFLVYNLIIRINEMLLISIIRFCPEQPILGGNHEKV
jgi:hypothetical protein